MRDTLTKPSEPDKVDAYMKNLKDPLAGVARTVNVSVHSTWGHRSPHTAE